MSSALLDKIQASIGQLPYAEKLLLVEWIIRSLRVNSSWVELDESTLVDDSADWQL
ncbi:MAG: hypothetical protein F6J97_25910, partial [Leptolyngbya sp. SIO4C1]|nr:hypothetical protein [Leptolyngbya sp. SIO4C1]